jgi:sugar phosphate isomerase/epimerase
MKPRIKAHSRLGARKHHVELAARVEGQALVMVEVLRANRADAKSDVRLVMSTSAARDLMRALQSVTDEADRRAYQAAKNADLETVVDQLVNAGVA